MMRTALQWGVKHRHIKENVADFADKPAHVRYQGAEPYTIQEIASLLSCTQNEPINQIRQWATACAQMMRALPHSDDHAYPSAFERCPG